MRIVIFNADEHKYKCNKVRSIVHQVHLMSDGDDINCTEYLCLPLVCVILYIKYTFLYCRGS